MRTRVSFRADLLVAVAAAARAAGGCGGRLQPLDAGADEGGLVDAAGPADATSDVDGGGGNADAGAPDGEPCIRDASDDTPLCTPPADDTLFARPAVVNVAAGSYGVATFVAGGPWSSDPGMYMHFESSSLSLLNHPQVTTYGSPQSILFQVATSQVGQQGTFTVSGHEGNIARSAQATVNVTSCAPWPPSVACPGRACGLEPDDCGGLVSCGTCSGATPYCYLGQCSDSMPHPCPGGEGFDPDGGACVPCQKSSVCGKACAFGTCITADSQCICFTSPGG